MILSVTRRVDIPVTIKYRTSDEDVAEGLYIIVGDWSWQGPISTVQEAKEKRSNIEQALADTWEQVIIDGGVTGTNMEIVVKLAFEGKPIVRPDRLSW